MTPINRLFEIIYYLMRKKNVTSQELAEHFGVSRRTICRDINTLSLAGIPVYSSKGNGGGIGLMEEFVLNKSVLSESEQNEILSALHGLSTVKTEETTQLLQKLGSFFNKNTPDWFDVDFISWGYGGECNLFPLIKSAIFEKRIIKFEYYSSYGDKTLRRVEPIQLRFKSRAWYFKGFCLDKNDVRLFKLTRMRDTIITEETFQKRDFNEYDKRQNNPEESKENRFPEIKLVMKISAELTHRVYDSFSDGQITKNDDGSFTVTMIETDENWLYGYILSFGEYAEVLEPERVKDIIKEKARKIFNNYS